jgi:hypothetical protein
MRLSRSLFLLSLFAASSFALQIQVGGGIDVGLQDAWLDNGVIETPLVGLNVPVFLTDEHGVQLSVRYSPKGYENDITIFYDCQWLHYLDIPLCYIYYPNFFPIDLGLTIGGYYSILMGVSDKGQNGFEKTPFDSLYTKSDYGFLVGVHYKRPISYGALVFSIEYCGGLSTIRTVWPDLYDPNHPEIRPVKNHAVSFCLGYDLPRFGSSGGTTVKKPAKDE